MKYISGVLIDENTVLTFEEICSATHAENNLILQLIENQIIHPKGASQSEWEFDSLALKRARLARNFYYDCEVNLAGIGLLIDLLERVEALESEINRK